MLFAAEVFTIYDADDSDASRGSEKGSGKCCAKGRGDGLHDAGPPASFTPEQFAGFNAMFDDQDEGGEWADEEKPPHGGSVKVSVKVSVKASAKGSDKGHQVLRQSGFGPEDEVYGDAFAHVVVLMLKKWSTERGLGVGECVDTGSDYVGDVFLQVNYAVIYEPVDLLLYPRTKVRCLVIFIKVVGRVNRFLMRFVLVFLKSWPGLKRSRRKGWCSQWSRLFRVVVLLWFLVGTFAGWFAWVVPGPCPRDHQDGRMGGFLSSSFGLFQTFGYSWV